MRIISKFLSILIIFTMFIGITYLGLFLTGKATWELTHKNKVSDLIKKECLK